MDKLIAGYIRVSTEMQSERDSPINQEEMVKAYCEREKKQFKIFKDLGLSAKDTNRPGFKEMMSFVEKGQIEAIVVTKLDRITRSLKDLVKLKETLDHYAVSFISLTETLDTLTPMGRFSFYILGMVSELEREMTAQRVAEDMKGRAKRKLWNGGVNPYAFTSFSRLSKDYLAQEARKRSATDSKALSVQELKQFAQELRKDENLKARAEAFAREKSKGVKGIFVDESEAKVVRKIVKHYLKTQSAKAVVRYLNSNKIKTREGAPWSYTSVRRILSNPIYCGTLAYNRRQGEGSTSKPRPTEEHILVEDAVPAIVSKEIFNQAQDIIQRQKKTHSSVKRTRYLLSGLLECGFCSGKMYGYTGQNPQRKIYLYYKCSNQVKGYTVCQGNVVRLGQVEGMVLSHLKEFSANPESLKEKAKEHRNIMLMENEDILERQHKLHSRIEKLKEKMLKMIELYEDGLIDKEEFSARRAELEGERASLLLELQDVEQTIRSLDIQDLDVDTTVKNIKNLADVYDELNFDERRMLLRSVISNIVVHKHHVDLSFYALPKLLVAGCQMGKGSSLLPA